MKEFIRFNPGKRSSYGLFTLPESIACSSSSSSGYRAAPPVALDKHGHLVAFEAIQYMSVPDMPVMVPGTQVGL